MTVRVIAESNAALTQNKMKASLINFPFSLISGFSDLIDSLANRVPVTIITTMSDNKKAMTKPPYLVSVGDSKTPTKAGFVKSNIKNITK